MMNDSMYMRPYHRSCTGPIRRKTGSMFGYGMVRIISPILAADCADHAERKTEFVASVSSAKSVARGGRMNLRFVEYERSEQFDRCALLPRVRTQTRFLACFL